MPSIDEAEAVELANVIRKRGVKTIAICFVNSFANPANEHRMRDILARELAGTPHFDLERHHAGNLRA